MNLQRSGSGSADVGITRRHRLVHAALLACVGSIVFLLAPAAAVAQLSQERPTPSPHGTGGSPDGVEPNVPDVPAGAGAIRGRVTHETDPSAAAGVPVVLYALAPDGTPGLRGIVSADDGSFAFEQIASEPSIVYLVGARYREVPFGVRMSFRPGETERSIDLPIAEPTTDSANARTAEVLVRVDSGCEGVLVKESHSLENTGDFVIYVPESERAVRQPILQIPVPTGATNLESTVGDTLDWDGKTISFWGPLRPGKEELEFAYGLPTAEGSVEIVQTFPNGAGRVRVFSHTAGPILDAPGLESGAPLVIAGVSYEVLESRDVAPGATIRTRVQLRPAAEASQQIAAEESRLWLELDGAALTVDEQHHLMIDSAEPVRSSSGAPLLCLALDPAADELQFSTETLQLGLSRDPSGAIAVRGPLPAGPTVFSIRYRLAVTDDVVPFVREFPFEVPLLSILVADTGLVIETQDLHRRRPVRSQDRNYLHLEAFGVEPGSAVRLTVEPVALRRPLDQWASTAFAAVAGLLAIGFLIVPLRSVGDAPSEAAPSHYAEERESVLASLRSLEDDYETNKVNDADYAELRQQLRASAVALLSAERQPIAAAAAESISADPATCSDCGAELQQDALFCSRCGTKVAGESPSAESTA